MNASFEKKNKTQTGQNSHRKSNPAQSYPSRTLVQAQLEMTQPGDQNEQEANAVASTIVGGGKISRQISGGTGGSSGIAVSSQMESQLSRLQGGGRPMPDGLRSMMESGFGQDLSNVRLHTDSEAASMSSSIHAKAFTHGNDIYFNRGQFSPETAEGQRLVAHELTHTIQQSGKVARDPTPPSSDDSMDDVMQLNSKYQQLKGIVDFYLDAKKAVGKPVSDAVDKPVSLRYLKKLFSACEESWPRFVNGLKELSASGKFLGKVAGGADYFYNLVMTLEEAIRTFPTSAIGGVYYAFLFFTTLFDYPFPLPFPPILARLILKEFNVVTGIGQSLYEGPLESWGYNDWKQELTDYMVKRFGGLESTEGQTAGIITSTPIIGEAAYFTIKAADTVDKKIDDTARKASRQTGDLIKRNLPPNLPLPF